MPLVQRDLDRENRILDMYRSGMTGGQISDEFGISRQRVNQIILRNGLTSKDGGATVRFKKNTEKEKANRDWACFQKNGCDYDKYKEIRKIKSPCGATPKQAYKLQKHSARHRRIEWKFKNFYEWWLVWEKSGKWNKRGRHLGQYVMGRKDDKGPYSVDNVEIITCSSNISDGYAYKKRVSG